MIIFLDIDGVIATRRSYKEEPDKLDKKCIGVLNRLTDKLKAEIVISSTWRYMENIVDILKDGGVKAKVIGCTPRLHISRSRGHEIMSWIRSNNYNGDYLVIDDDGFDIIDVIPPTNFLYIKNGFSENGFTEEHISCIMNPPTTDSNYLDNQSVL